MSLDRFILILRMQARLIVGIFAASVVVAGIITYLTPKMYTATASLNFNIIGNPVDNQGKAVLTQNTYISTQQGIIESLNVAQGVEDSLTEYERRRLIAALEARRSVIDDVKHALTSPIKSLLNDDKKRIQKTGDGETLQMSTPYGWLARSIGSDLYVQPMFNSRIMEISYSSTDRQIAALLANRFAEAYIAANLKMTTDPASKSKEWFREQLKSLRNRLEEAQSRLTAYQQQEGIVSSDERLDTEIVRLQSLSGQHLAAQQATRNAVTERQKLKEVLDSGASLMTFEPVFNNPVVQKIKADIRDLEGRIVQGSSSLGKNHPKMKKMNSELSAAQIRLSREIQTISDGINNAAELSREREGDLLQAVESQKKLVLDLKNEHDKIAVLQREVESTQATYNSALNQLNTTSLQSMIDQTNVSVVDSASIPGTPSSPQVMVNLILGALGGLILGIGVAVLMEIFARRIYSREDFTVELGVPLLGQLKKFRQPADGAL